MWSQDKQAQVEARSMFHHKLSEGRRHMSVTFARQSKAAQNPSPHTQLFISPAKQEVNDGNWILDDIVLVPSPRCGRRTGNAVG